MCNNCNCSCPKPPLVFAVGKEYTMRDLPGVRRIVAIENGKMLVVNPTNLGTHGLRHADGRHLAVADHHSDLVAEYVAPPPRRIRYQNVYSKPKAGSVIGNHLFLKREWADATALSWGNRIAVMTVEVDEESNVIAIDKIECV
jgi:hypothetical protein